MQSRQLACVMMHRQFHLIYLSESKHFIAWSYGRRKSLFYSLLCQGCLYGLLHTRRHQACNSCIQANDYDIAPSDEIKKYSYFTRLYTFSEHIRRVTQFLLHCLVAKQTHQSSHSLNCLPCPASQGAAFPAHRVHPLTGRQSVTGLTRVDRQTH